MCVLSVRLSLATSLFSFQELVAAERLETQLKAEMKQEELDKIDEYERTMSKEEADEARALMEFREAQYVSIHPRSHHGNHLPPLTTVDITLDVPRALLYPCQQ